MAAQISWDDLWKNAPDLAKQIQEQIRAEEKLKRETTKEKTKRSGPKPREPNGLETDFKQHWIDANIDYSHCFYEPFRIPSIVCASDDGRKETTEYKPDWLVLTSDGRTQVYEVKGYERTKDYQRFKAAAERWGFHWEFFYCQRVDGVWSVVRYGGARA